MLLVTGVRPRAVVGGTRAARLLAWAREPKVGAEGVNALVAHGFSASAAPVILGDDGSLFAVFQQGRFRIRRSTGRLVLESDLPAPNHGHDGTERRFVGVALIAPACLVVASQRAKEHGVQVGGGGRRIDVGWKRDGACPGAPIGNDAEEQVGHGNAPRDGKADKHGGKLID